MDLAVSIVIAQPVEVVFAYISNYEHDSQWRAGIIEMIQTPPGRTQIGTKTREVARFFGKKRVTPAGITDQAISSPIPHWSTRSFSQACSGEIVYRASANQRLL